MAKSKTKLKPRGKPKPDSPVDVDDVEASNHDLVAPAKPVKPPKPVQPQPWLFRISLALFVSWLLYLAYVAYVVLSK